MSIGHKDRPQAKDITDRQMLRYLSTHRTNQPGAAQYRRYEIMARHFDSAPKVIEVVLERLLRRGLIDCGVSLRTAWLTPEGEALLADDPDILRGSRGLTQRSVVLDARACASLAGIQAELGRVGHGRGTEVADNGAGGFVVTFHAPTVHIERLGVGWLWRTEQRFATPGGGTEAVTGWSWTRWGAKRRAERAKARWT